MARKTVGVIGGVGPGATAAFYRNVVQKYAARTDNNLPALLIYSIPMEADIEQAILTGATGGPVVDRMIGMLQEGVDCLSRAGVDAIVMPCNTLQAYVPEMVARAGIPYIHLIAGVVNHIRCAGYMLTALICTAPMRALGLYQAELDAQAVHYVLPTEDEQADITRAILDTLHHAPDPNARLSQVVRRLEEEADSILLGCSDLTAFDDPSFTRLPVVDAMDVLAESTVNFLLS